MPRNKNKGRRQRKSPLSFRRLCRIAGITPKERILMIRYMKKHLKEVS